MSTETTTPPNPLLSLRAGDNVILDSSRYGAEQLSVVRIFRVTETQIVLRTERENAPPLDYRYDRSTGRLRGADAYNGSRIMVPTPELMNRAEKRMLVDRISSTKWATLSLETLRAVNAAIKTQVP